MKVVNINSVNHQHHLDGLQATLMEDPITPKATSDVGEAAMMGQDTPGGESHGGGGCCSGIVLPSSQSKTNQIQALLERHENPQSVPVAATATSNPSP